LVGLGIATFLVALAVVPSGVAVGTALLVVAAVLVVAGTFAPVLPGVRRLPVIGAPALPALQISTGSGAEFYATTLPNQEMQQAGALRNTTATSTRVTSLRVAETAGVRAENVRVVISATDPQPTPEIASFPRDLSWFQGDPNLPELETTLPAGGRAYVMLQMVTEYQNGSRVLGAPLPAPFWVSQSAITVTVEAWIGDSLADRRQFKITNLVDAPGFSALYPTVSEVG